MIEQGYPGGPRPEGSHRAVDCSHCGRPEARRTLIARVNRTLAEMMKDPEGVRITLRDNPELAARLRKALRL